MEHAEVTETVGDASKEVESKGETGRPAGNVASPRSPAGEAAAPPRFYRGELIAKRFSIVDPLGRGGMGEVYEAVDQELGQRVALKTLRSGAASDEDRRRRLRQEILLARQVTHPNVCRLFDLSYHTPQDRRQDRLPLLSMELLSGETLDARLRREGPLQPTEVRRLAFQIASGLAAAHSAGVVHCDLKASNIMLVPHDDGPRAVVMDFGIASTSRPQSTAEESSPGSGSRAGGTPGYVAPEVLSGEPVTPAADVYSLGVVIAEMATGRRLSWENPQAIPGGPQIDPFLRPIVSRCLQLDPGRRFSTAEEILDRLAARRATPPGVVAMGLAVLLLLTLALVFSLAQRPSGPRLALTVMSLQNLDGNTAQEWISSVLPELLGSKLTLGGKVRLVTRDTLKEMRLDRAPAPRDALSSRELDAILAATGADYVLAGGYRTTRVGSPGLEVRLELYDTRSGETAAVFEQRVSTLDLAPLIDALTRDLLAHLSLSAHDVEPSPPRDSRAARLYAEGLRALDAFRVDDAVPKLEEALAADSTFWDARLALIRAHLELGDLASAGAEVKTALACEQERDRGQDQTRKISLTLKALEAEAAQDWEAAYATWNALWTFFPDEVEYGLGVVRALTESSRGVDALAAVDRLRDQVPHLAGDPRIDLAEARAAGRAGEFERQLAAARKAEEKALRLPSVLLQARSRLEASAALRVTESYGEALAEAREARRFFEAVDHLPGKAEALLEESFCLRGMARRELAAQRAKEARGIYLSLKHRQGAADALSKLASSQLSDPPEARRLYMEAYQEYQAIDDRAGLAAMLHNLGLTYMREGDYERSFEYHRQALGAFRNLKDAVGESRTLNSLGYYYYHAKRDIESALDALEGSLAIKQRLKDRSAMAISHLNLGNIYIRTGAVNKAEMHYTEGEKLAKETEQPSRRAEVLGGLAVVRLYQNRLDEAEALIEDALELRQLGGASDGHRERWIHGRICLERGNLDGAWKIAEQLLASARAIGPQWGRLMRAQILTSRGDVQSSKSELAQLEAGNDNDEDWIDLHLRRQRIEVKHLQLAGDVSAARELNKSIVSQAEQLTFKFHELEARIKGCHLESEMSSTQKCLGQIRTEVKELGQVLLLRRIDDRSKVPK